LRETGGLVARSRAGESLPHIIGILILGLAAGILVGLMGIGGGIVIVPALVHLFGMDQHTAQGTSLLLQLPPIGIGALYLYWKKGHVDLPAGVAIGIGYLLGAFLGSLVAVRISGFALRITFGIFLVFAAVLLWRQNNPQGSTGSTDA
jgi:uncharacterized membrane protein YfcA